MVKQFEDKKASKEKSQSIFFGRKLAKNISINSKFQKVQNS